MCFAIGACDKGMYTHSICAHIDRYDIDENISEYRLILNITSPLDV